MMQLESKIDFKDRPHDDDMSRGDEETDENAKIFPQRLMEILSNPDNTEAISWLPHGRAFIIINRQKFANSVLPVYFRKTKYTSFTRKLNRWNFTRVTRGPELGAYYHEFFQRGNEALCTQMYCKNERAKFAVSKGTSSKENKNQKCSSATRKSTSLNPSDPASSDAELQKAGANDGPGMGITQMSALSKQILPAANPTLQTRAALLGQRSQVTDPMTQSFIENAIRGFRSPLMMQQGADAGALLRMQQLATIQQQLQQLQQQQQRLPNRGFYNLYRASAA